MIAYRIYPKTGILFGVVAYRTTNETIKHRLNHEKQAENGVRVTWIRRAPLK